MKVTRRKIWDCFDMRWCPKCGKVVDMEPVRTNLPAILAQKCPECNGGFQSNFLEDETDLLDCPDTFIFPSDEVVNEYHERRKAEATRI